MKVACLCCTYLRPRALAEAISCFEHQELSASRRELVVLDDAGQYSAQAGPGWRIISVSQRFRTLGEKRNAAAGLASPDVDAYAVWDDDDLYLPWHLSKLLPLLERSAWVIPERVLVQRRGGLSVVNSRRLFHAAWVFRREALERVSGYPFQQKGEDQALRARFEAAAIVPSVALRCEPSFVYRWFVTPGEWHLSALGPGGYEALGSKTCSESASNVVPRLPRGWRALLDVASRSQLPLGEVRNWTHPG